MVESVHALVHMGALICQDSCQSPHSTRVADPVGADPDPTLERKIRSGSDLKNRSGTDLIIYPQFLFN